MRQVALRAPDMAQDRGMLARLALRRNASERLDGFGAQLERGLCVSECLARHLGPAALPADRLPRRRPLLRPGLRQRLVAQHHFSRNGRRARGAPFQTSAELGHPVWGLAATLSAAPSPEG